MVDLRLLIVVAATAGCASAGAALDGVDGGDGGDGTVDAGPTIDAPTGADASVTPPADAPGGCTVMTRNLLTNNSFDLAPLGTGWVEAPIDPIYPIITADGTLVQSAPNKAWLGGLARSPANDHVYQEVAVPAGTTSLVLTGYYEVRTAETLPLTFDRGRVELTTPANTVLQQVLAVDNQTPTATWTAINHTFSTPYAGQTVRLRLSSSSDASAPTSFFFDTLALTATYCQ